MYVDRVLFAQRSISFCDRINLKCNTFREWLNYRYEAWADNQPSGNGDCMGYSAEHSLYWDDIPCEDYTGSGLLVGFLCQNQSVTQG